MATEHVRIASLRQKFAQTPISRAHDRLKLEVPVAVEILIPEDTFRPHELQGFTLNISASGMQLALEKMESQLYSRMLARQRMARVALKHPRTAKEISIMGKIAWIDFRRDSGRDASGDCSLGLAFSEKIDGVDLTDYLQLVDDAKLMLRDAEPVIRILEL